MNLETLQNEMIAAMKARNKERKDTISSIVGAVKKAGIDKGCRDNIPEELVNQILLKEQKTVQEMIDTCPADRAEKLMEYQNRMSVIKEFVPVVKDNPEEIQAEIEKLLKENNMDFGYGKGLVMKLIAGPLKAAGFDMKAVNKVVSDICK